MDVRPGQGGGLHDRRRPALGDAIGPAGSEYDRFFSQMVRWSMRPTGDTGKFTVATDVQGSKTRVVVSALDKDDEFLNYQTMTGTVLGPGHEVDSARHRADGAGPVRGRVRFVEAGQLHDHGDARAPGRR